MMRVKMLTVVARFADKHPVLMFSIALLITSIAAGLASQLKLVMHIKDLMPESHPMVQEFNRITDDYSTASIIIVAAKGDEQELKQFADEIAPKIRALTQYVKRVDYKLERDFFLKHGLLLEKAKDLKNNKDLFSDLSPISWLRHLNDSFEKTYVHDQESISTKEKENNAVAFLDGIKYWLKTLDRFATEGESRDPAIAEAAVERFLIGDPYFISQDKDMLLLFAQPTFTIMEIDKVVDATNSIDALIADISPKYPSIFAGTTGAVALNRDEMNAVSSDMYFTSLLALLLIVALFVLSFRMWVAPILAGLTLIIGIVWTAGFATIATGGLNLMTSMFSVILIGLGVDFSIHFISVYTEHRAEGYSVGEALRQTFLKSGNGIIIGSLTTACAFFTLTVSESVGMKEFGIIAGSGVLFCMLAALLVLPAMLSLRDKILIKLNKEKSGLRAPRFKYLGGFSEAIAKHPILSLSATIMITAFMLYSGLQITFDYNYLNMEPVGLTSIRLQHDMESEFDATPDFALITASSVEEARRITEAAKDLKMIGMVNSISEYVPSPEQQAERLPLIHEIRQSLENNRTTTPLSERSLDAFFDELYRLDDNIIELAQLAYLGGQDKVDEKCKELIGNLEDKNNKTEITALVNKLKADRKKTVQNLNYFYSLFEPRFRQMALGMASTEPISVEMLPQNIRNQFINKTGDKFLVTIYPKEQVWNFEFLERFTDQMQKLDPRITGIPMIFYILMEIIARDGRVAAGLTILVVFLLLLLDFRNLRFTMMAMVPLVFGAIWMVGIMQLVGLQLTMMNVIGLPLILGIGIDDGVHILHRFRVEGNGRIRTVFTSTGKAVLLTSITTMLAFGSLLFATYRGLGSLGIALFIGVGACFLTTMMLLPAMLGLIGKMKEKVEKKVEVELQATDSMHSV